MKKSRLIHIFFVLSACTLFCSPITLIAKRVTEDIVSPQEYPFGHSTVWPGYGCPTMNNSEEYTHGLSTLDMYCCYYHIAKLVQMIQRVECFMNIMMKMK